MGRKSQKKRKFPTWFRKSNSSRVFYSEILEAKEKRAEKIARRRTTKK